MNRNLSLKHVITVVALFLLFLNIRVRSQTRAGESGCLVTGSILDQKGAVILIPRPVVVIRGNNTVKEITVNENGRFEATLPSGTYYVTTEIPGFYPFRRAPFKVVAGENLMINLVPSRRYFVRGTSLSNKVSVDEVAPPPKYEQVRVPKSNLSGFIQFESGQTVGRNVRYRFAVFSYDHITVYADELLFNRKTLRLTTSGKGVTLEDRKQRIELKGLTVSFQEGEARVDLIRNSHR